MRALATIDAARRLRVALDAAHRRISARPSSAALLPPSAPQDHRVAGPVAFARGNCRAACSPMHCGRSSTSAFRYALAPHRRRIRRGKRATERDVDAIIRHPTAAFPARAFGCVAEHDGCPHRRIESRTHSSRTSSQVNEVARRVAEPQITHSPRRRSTPHSSPPRSRPSPRFAAATGDLRARQLGARAGAHRSRGQRARPPAARRRHATVDRTIEVEQKGSVQPDQAPARRLMPNSAHILDLARAARTGGERAQKPRAPPLLRAPCSPQPRAHAAGVPIAAARSAPPSIATEAAARRSRRRSTVERTPGCGSCRCSPPPLALKRARGDHHTTPAPRRRRRRTSCRTGAGGGRHPGQRRAQRPAAPTANCAPRSTSSPDRPARAAGRSRRPRSSPSSEYVPRRRVRHASGVRAALVLDTIDVR